MNLLVYLNSGQPDIRSFRNDITCRGGTGSKPVNKDRDLSTLAINLVGYSWKKDRQIHKDAWYVEPFFRWQRYGVGNSLVKLITVQGHERGHGR